MKKKLLLSILTSMSLLSGLIGLNNSLIKESATDGLAINETSVALKGRKFIDRNSLDSKKIMRHF